VTWSIIARDAPTRRVGIIVATRFFAVGCMVPHIKTGVGAVATQAFINPLYGPQGLAQLESGLSAEDAVGRLTSEDAGRDHRQLHVMDRNGRCAGYTGATCIDWCGHIIQPSFSIAGNMLAGPAVLAETIRAYEAAPDLPLARRLIAAMQAGEAAGGDKRGKQSAALLISSGEEWSALDLRVDDHADPLADLERLERVSRERWVHFRKFLPTRQNPAGITDRATIDASIAEATAGES